MYVNDIDDMGQQYPRSWRNIKFPCFLYCSEITTVAGNNLVVRETMENEED